MLFHCDESFEYQAFQVQPCLRFAVLDQDVPKKAAQSFNKLLDRFHQDQSTNLSKQSDENDVATSSQNWRTRHPFQGQRTVLEWAVDSSRARRWNHSVKANIYGLAVNKVHAYSQSPQASLKYPELYRAGKERMYMILGFRTQKHVAFRKDFPSTL